MSSANRTGNHNRLMMSQSCHGRIGDCCRQGAVAAKRSIHQFRLGFCVDEPIKKTLAFPIVFFLCTVISLVRGSFF